MRCNRVGAIVRFSDTPATFGKRLAVNDVSTKYRGNTEYFRRLSWQMENGGYEAMLWDLLHRNIEGWSPEPVPVTTALIAQKRLSLPEEVQWLENVLQRGVLPVPVPGYPNRCASNELLKDLREFFPYANSKVMAEVLRSIGADDVNSGFRGWIFPTLPLGRKRFEMVCGGGDWAWKNDLTQWQGTQKTAVVKRVRIVEPVVEPDDGLPPKAREISSDGELAAILKMPISSVAPEPKVVPLASWRRF
jgi:hypothetical protein